MLPSFLLNDCSRCTFSALALRTRLLILRVLDMCIICKSISIGCTGLISICDCLKSWNILNYIYK